MAWAHAYVKQRTVLMITSHTYSTAGEARMCVCARVCERAFGCVRALYVHACLRAFVSACMRACARMCARVCARSRARVFGA